MSELVVVEGRWAVEALLESAFFTTLRVLVQKGRHKDTKDRAEAAGVAVEELSAEEVSACAGYDFHRGIFAEAIRPAASEPSAAFLSKATRMVIPVHLADPGNLGTIVRTAAAFGADGILVEKGKGADIYSRIAIRASARAIFRLPVFECALLGEQLEGLRELGFTIYATALGEESSLLPEIRPAEKCAILFGAERDGLSADVISQADQSIRIPMIGEMDSLNVAASAAVVMWELFGKDG